MQSYSFFELCKIQPVLTRKNSHFGNLFKDVITIYIYIYCQVITSCGCSYYYGCKELR